MPVNIMEIKGFNPVRVNEAFKHFVRINTPAQEKIKQGTNRPPGNAPLRRFK